MPSDRLQRLRASTRPARRWLAAWLLHPLTTRRWVVVVLVLVALVGGCLLSGCATEVTP